MLQLRLKLHHCYNYNPNGRAKLIPTIPKPHNINPNTTKAIPIWETILDLIILPTMQPLPSLAPQNTRMQLSQLTPSGPPQTNPYSVSNYIAPRALNDFQRLDNNFARPF